MSVRAATHHQLTAFSETVEELTAFSVTVKGPTGLEPVAGDRL